MSPGSEGAGVPEEASVPTSGSEGDGARLVLEHPTGEVAASPIPGVIEDGDGAASTFVVSENARQSNRHAVIGEEVLVDATAIVAADIVGGAALRDGECGLDAREKGLTDAFTREGVSRHDRIAHDECSTHTGDGLIDASRNRPRSVTILEFDVGSESLDDVRSL